MAYQHSNDGGGGSLRGVGSGGGEYSGDELDSRSGGDDRPDSDMHDKPVYLLEHLATFTVNKDSGIVYPADGMRRLLQLEKTTGIWSQKMQLCLDYQWVLIMDYETGNIIERFPATLIQEPTAFTSTDAMELYNNILVFIVSGGSGSRSEMHIFQSQSVSAVHLVEDMKNLRSGKMVPQQREVPHKSGGNITRTMNTLSVLQSRSEFQQQQHQQQQQHHHLYRDGRSGGGVGVEQFGARSAIALDSGHNAVGGGVGGGNGETDSDHGGLNDETSSTSSDKYERDVTVLNHCFDDIEKFIARLQHAAAASRELDRRRRNRKTKKKDLGEGLLTLRTRPPHEKEFIDIFAKFKLSFNLLAKLKAHIHDPNAPELVHFLFTPLALIVEASSDTYYESQLPARVVNPLLTREAINLLINCVTSKETELWRSLGDAWIVPRDQWKDDVGSYHPVFLDGWSPDYLVIDELETPVTPTNIGKRCLETPLHSHTLSHGGAAAALNDRIAVNVADEYDGGGMLSEKYSVHYGHAGNERSERLNDSGGGGGGGAADFGSGYDPSHHHGGGGAPNSGVMQAIAAGMQNLQTRESRAGAMNQGGVGELSGRSADEQMLEAWLEELQAAGAKIVLVTYPRTANNDKELSVVRGEYLEILDDSRKWWKARNMRGQIAHVPHTIVTPYNYGDNEVTAPQTSHFYGHQQQQQQLQANYKQQSRHAPTENISDNVEQRTQEASDWVRNKHLALFNSAAAKRQRSRSSPPKYGAPFAGAQAFNYEQQQHQRQPDARGYSECARPVQRYVPAPPPLPAAPKPSNTPLTNNHTTNNAYVGSSHRVLSNNCNNNINSGTINTNGATAIGQRVEGKNEALHRTEINRNTEASASSKITIYEQPQPNATSGGGAMQEELKYVLRMRERRGDLDIHKTPTVYIEQKSSATDVASWLRAKDFSPATVQRLAGLTGEQLFALPPAQCEELFGLREGRRLASQLKLQKSVSGYKTARSSELQAVLARARPKSEMQT